MNSEGVTWKLEPPKVSVPWMWTPMEVFRLEALVPLRRSGPLRVKTGSSMNTFLFLV